MHWLTWTDAGRQSWPPIHPDYVLLPEAMEAIAANTFGSEWTGKEFVVDEVMVHGVPSADEAFPTQDAEPDAFQLRNHGQAVRFWIGMKWAEVPNYSDWKLAQDRFTWHIDHRDVLLRRKEVACRFVQKLAMLGRLKVYWRNVATGEMELMPESHWNCDADIAEARFALARINPMPFQCMRPTPSVYADRYVRDNYFRQMTAWLFVSKANLAELIGQPPAAEPVTANPLEAADAVALVDEPVVPAELRGGRTVCTAPARTPRRREKSDTPAQKALRKFLPIAARAGVLRGGNNELSFKMLHAQFKDWCAKQRPQATPMKISAFKKWMARYYEGEWAQGVAVDIAASHDTATVDVKI